MCSGTPQYFAPEVSRRQNSCYGAGRYGSSADMWSLGVTLYILLSGTFPFSEANLVEEQQKGIYSFAGSEWEAISHAAKHLVRQLMELKPEERLSADKALLHPWIRQQSLDTPLGVLERGYRFSALPTTTHE